MVIDAADLSFQFLSRNDSQRAVAPSTEKHFDRAIGNGVGASVK